MAGKPMYSKSQLDGAMVDFLKQEHPKYTTAEKRSG